MVLRKALFTLLFISILASCKEDGFVSPLYKGKIPLAAIRNMPVINEQECIFTLKEDTQIQIYASAEASIDIVNVDPAYLYKPDEIEVYMKHKNGKALSISFPLTDSNDTKNTIEYNAGGVGFTAEYNNIRRLYLAKMAIPFSVIGVPAGNASEKVLLNVALADNDDYIKQKAKLVWVGKKDPLLTPEVSYGELLFVKERSNTFVDTASHVVSYAIAAGKGSAEESLPAVPISNLIFGQINQAEDFSATMSSAWNQDTIFLYFTVLDNKEGRREPEKLRNMAFFHDYGWIEDEKGNVAWKMTNLQTQHAGGALKNRKVDTAVFLKKGNYKLKYITDESHSWNNWDDEPPVLPFYGIEIFNKR